MYVQVLNPETSLLLWERDIVSVPSVRTFGLVQQFYMVSEPRGLEFETPLTRIKKKKKKDPTARSYPTLRTKIA